MYRNYKLNHFLKITQVNVFKKQLTISSPIISNLFTTTTTREPSTEANFIELNDNNLATQLFINNKFHNSNSGKKFDTINPGNGQVLAQIAEAQIDDVDHAVQAAHDAFYHGKWSTFTPREK